METTDFLNDLVEVISSHCIAQPSVEMGVISSHCYAQPSAVVAVLKKHLNGKVGVVIRNLVIDKFLKLPGCPSLGIC